MKYGFNNNQIEEEKKAINKMFLKLRKHEIDGLFCDGNKYISLTIITNKFIPVMIKKYLNKGVTLDHSFLQENELL